MTQIAHIENYHTANPVWSRNKTNQPTLNSFGLDTVLDCDAFRKLPILVVTSGAIGLQHILGDGRQTISVLFFEGDVIDTRHFCKASGNLICVLPTATQLYSAEDFNLLQQKSTKFQIEQSSSQARQSLNATQHSVDLARKSAVEKLASFIFECRKRQKLGRGLTVCLRLRRSDIADYMGLRAETLSRAFTKLKKMDFIDADEADVIQILNEPGMRQLANGKKT